MNQEQQTYILKCAAQGFAQELINRGVDKSAVAQLTANYAGNGGSLEKRAANRANARTIILNARNVLRGALA